MRRRSARRRRRGKAAVFGGTRIRMFNPRVRTVNVAVYNMLPPGCADAMRRTTRTCRTGDRPAAALLPAGHSSGVEVALRL
jgi:hypothetical protein